MIEYFEYKLKKLYIELDNSNTINYQEVKTMKETIQKLKGEILEGVQIRSKLEEAKYGEMPSSYLVGKFKSESTKKSIYKLVAEESFENINVIETTDKINEYATNYYQKLY